MNILLIYPEYPKTFWSFDCVLKFVGKKASFPPLGLMTIAAMLPSSWQKNLIDVNICKLRDKDIEWADMVFISAMIVQKKGVVEVVKRCKSFGKTIVAGGPLFWMEHNKFTEVDHFVLDEAEITLPLFLQDLTKGCAQKLYVSHEKPSLEKTPIPLWSLINLKKYATMPVQYSRGCPFDCEFCDIVAMNGRIPRTKTAKQIIAEFQALYNAGWRGSVFIVDDNFIGNKVKVKEMLWQLIEWQEKNNYPFCFLTEASVNLSEDVELMQLMSKANFYKVFLGIETPCVESLKECGKDQNVRINLATAIKKIQQNGMQVMGGFIVGFDNDPPNIFDAVSDFIQNNAVVTAMVGILTALPRTKLYQRLQKENRLLGDSNGENSSSINFIPKMGIKDLEEGYKKILTYIYAPKNYYKRINLFVKNYNPTVKAKLTKEDVRAFVRSTWRIGIFSKARFFYWKLLLRNFFSKKRRKALPMAIELAIMGLHFSAISKKIIKTKACS